MKPIRLTPEFEAVSRHVIWFEEPAQAVSDPVRFIAYAKAYGTHEDMKTVRGHSLTMNSSKLSIRLHLGYLTDRPGPIGI